MSTTDNSSMRRAIAYSLLAHIKNSGNLTNGPLDIFVPLVKNILHKKKDVKGAHVSEIRPLKWNMVLIYQALSCYKFFV